MDDRGIYAVGIYFHNGRFENFTEEYTRAKLERDAPWLPLSEIDWVRLVDEGLYRGPIFFKTQLVYAPDREEDKPWDNTVKLPEYRDGVFVFRWRDITGVRVTYLNPSEQPEP